MSEQEVPRVATHVTAIELVEAVESVWTEIVGTPVDRETTLLLVAQSAFEDGWWLNCWNYNLENAKKVDGDGHDFYFVACDEYIHGVLKRLEPPDPGCRFRALATLPDGVRDWLRLMVRQYPRSLAAAATHDPVKFATELHAERFYTDIVAHYIAQVVGCLAMLRRQIAAAMAEEPLAPNPDGGRILEIARGVDAGDEGLPPDSTPPEAA